MFSVEHAPEPLRGKTNGGVMHKADRMFSAEQNA
jgi:hypothetical protein